MAYQDTSAYRDLYGRILGAAPMWDQSNTSSKLGQYANQFAGMFRNMVGRDPTNDEFNAFFQNVGGEVAQSPSGFAGTSYADLQNLINPFIQNQYGQQVQQYQQGQQEQQLQRGESMIQDLIKKQSQEAIKQLQSPETVNALKGSYNNLGINDSGAFQTGIANRLADAESGNISAALGNFGLPAISSQYQSAGAPYQQSLSQMYPGLQNYGQQQSNLYDFGLQSDLARQLSDSGGNNPLLSGLFTGALGGAAVGSRFGPWGAALGGLGGAGLGASTGGSRGK